MLLAFGVGLAAPAFGEWREGLIGLVIAAAGIFDPAC